MAFIYLNLLSYLKQNTLIMSDDLELVYRQISCLKAVSLNSFSGGVQDFNWSIGGKTGWIPSKSYFRIGMTVTGAGGAAQPSFTEQIALADGVLGNLYNNAYFRAGGQDVSSIVNYASQAAAIKNRLDKSNSFMKTIGKGSLWLESDYNKRILKTCSKTGLPASFAGSEGLTTRKFVPDDEKKDASYRVEVTTDGAVDLTDCTYPTTPVAGDQILVNGMVFTFTSSTTIQPKPSPAVNSGANGSALIIERPNNGDGRNVNYGIWQPPIGIFDHDQPMGAGDYRIQLNPNAYYKTSAVEKRSGVGLPGTDFNFEVTSVELYIATVKYNPASRGLSENETGVETLHLMEQQIQTKTLSEGVNETLLDFTVPSSTKAITLFVQSGKAGNTTKLTPSTFKALNGSDLNLATIHVSYANQVKPSTRWTSEYNDTTNKLLQRYNDTQMNSGMYSNEGGTESFGDWIKRGPYYHWSWSRDKDDRSTQAQVSISFNSPGIEEGCNLFLVAHYTKTCQISLNNGFVTEVNSLAV